MVTNEEDWHELKTMNLKSFGEIFQDAQTVMLLL